jgi:hypothetical protein
MVHWLQYIVLVQVVQLVAQAQVVVPQVVAVAEPMLP